MPAGGSDADRLAARPRRDDERRGDPGAAAVSGLREAVRQHRESIGGLQPLADHRLIVRRLVPLLEVVLAVELQDDGAPPGGVPSITSLSTSRREPWL